MEIKITPIQDKMFKGRVAFLVESPKLTKVYHVGLCNYVKNPFDKWNMQYLLSQVVNDFSKLLSVDDFQKLEIHE